MARRDRHRGETYLLIRPIVIYPDVRLRQPAATVDLFDDDLQVLATDLLDTMRAAPGIGITAPHIGVLQRVVVIALPDDGVVRTYVNPMVVHASAETRSYPEGSVSMPGVSEEIERPAKVRVRFQDLWGSVETADADGLLAVCLQHEIDQLNGVFWIDRLSRLKRERVVKRFEKLQRSR